MTAGSIPRRFLRVFQANISEDQDIPTADNSVIEEFISRKEFLHLIDTWREHDELWVSFGPPINLDPTAVRLSRNSLYGWNQFIADSIQSLFDNIERTGPLSDQIGIFLCENPDLIEVIDETNGKIPTYFGDDASLELRLLMNDEDDVTLLTLAVRTSLDVDSAFDALNRFEDEWYFERFDEAITNFIIDITFK